MVFDVIAQDILGGLFGGGAAFSVPMAALFGLTILVVILFAARLNPAIAFVLVSPAIILASVGGLLPSAVFGVSVIILAVIFTGILLSLFS
jgi:hypothetical protein